ncbi:hypothetical protein [Gluconobacter cerinus]|uniref:hypothetical protein n=1 Tax=Gluconobacter cerinus TaxID=38307 RepID=UPI001B8C914C|nr:hypothetical protein [Gluconobacter cerinus]MBS1026485.1 hypothetical protein [Gluconobacter cerinus]MBS1045567.1 hypothetical protein [Gluconobacter cerinus]
MIEQFNKNEVYNNKNVEAETVLKHRLFGMVLGLFLAHAYVALALYYTYIDHKNHFHTSWMALFGCFVSSMIFLYHIGISKAISEKENGIYGRYFAPFMSSSLWGFVLVAITVITIIQGQAWFSPYEYLAWPLAFASIFVGYFIGPAMDHSFSFVLKSLRK